MSLGPLYVTLGWKCGNGKGQRHYQFNLWFAVTTDQDHVMAWLPFCLSRLDWFAKANPCNHSCQSRTFCVDSHSPFQTFQTCQYLSLLKNKQHNLKTICHWVNLDINQGNNRYYCYSYHFCETASIDRISLEARRQCVDVVSRPVLGLLRCPSHSLKTICPL